MASSVLDNQGRLHIVTGSITGGDTISSNDGSVTLTDTGTGDWTINFGDAFLSAPTVLVTPIIATAASTIANHVQIEAVTASEATVIARTKVAASALAAADLNVSFVAIGLRNN